MRRQYDAIIVGAGPAGASCALWLARLGLSPLLVEAGDQPGGLALSNPFADHWIAVLPDVTGRQVAGNIARSLALARVALLAGHRAVSVEPVSDGFAARVRDSAGTMQTVHGAHVVVASGVRARGLPEAQGREYPGVLVGPGAHVAGQDFRGRSVAVLGGGDNGFENAAYVRQQGAAHVDIYARSVRAQRQWVAQADPACVHVGGYQVDPAARSVNGRAYDLILVFYGWEPQADFADSLGLARDDRGFIRTEPATAQASLAGVYAIGEVARRMHPCVVTAMADGVVAAKAIQARVESARQAAN